MTMNLQFPAIWSEGTGGWRDRFHNVFDKLIPWKREPAPEPVARFNPLAQWWAEPSLPAVDMWEDDDAIHVTAELPGLDRKDFSVEVTANRLVLRGEKNHTREENGRNHFYRECSYGAFSRPIPLPAEVDADKAQARYKHGILTIDLPKTEEARARRVHVTVK